MCSISVIKLQEKHRSVGESLEDPSENDERLRKHDLQRWMERPGVAQLSQGNVFFSCGLCGIQKIETEEIIVSVHPWYIGEEVISLNSKTNDLY